MAGYDSQLFVCRTFCSGAIIALQFHIERLSCFRTLLPSFAHDCLSQVRISYLIGLSTCRAHDKLPGLASNSTAQVRSMCILLHVLQLHFEPTLISCDLQIEPSFWVPFRKFPSTTKLNCRLHNEAVLPSSYNGCVSLSAERVTPQST